MINNWLFFVHSNCYITYLIKNRKDLCNWFETSQTSFLNNDDGFRKCEIALACDSSLPTECTKMEESDESGGSSHGQPPTSTKSQWGIYVAIAFGIIFFFILFTCCITFVHISLPCFFIGLDTCQKCWTPPVKHEKWQKGIHYPNGKIVCERGGVDSEII